MSQWCSRAIHPEIDMSSLSLPPKHICLISLITICTRTLQSGLQVSVLLFQIIHNSRKFRRVVANQLLRTVLLGDVSLLSDSLLCQCTWHVDIASTMFETTANSEQDRSYLRSGVGAVVENMLHHIDDQDLVCFVFAHKLAVLLAPKQFLPSWQETCEDCTLVDAFGFWFLSGLENKHPGRDCRTFEKLARIEVPLKNVQTSQNETYCACASAPISCKELICLIDVVHGSWVMECAYKEEWEKLGVKPWNQMNENKVCNLRLKIVYLIALLTFYIPVDAIRDETMMVESQASWESYCNFESH